MENLRTRDKSGKWKVKTCLSPSRSDLVVQNSRFDVITRRQSRDLQIEHGFRACFFRKKGTGWIFKILVVENLKKTEMFDEIGRCVVTRKVGKAGGELLANVRTEKHEQLENNFETNTRFARGVAARD